VDHYGVFNIFYRGMVVVSDVSSIRSSKQVLPFLIFILKFPGVHSIQGAMTTIWWLRSPVLDFNILFIGSILCLDLRAVFEEQPGSHHHRLPFRGTITRMYFINARQKNSKILISSIQRSGNAPDLIRPEFSTPEKGLNMQEQHS
jgi:hypothetical protein